MPLPVDDLFKAYQEGRNEDVINLIKKHSELVNAIHAESDYSFMKVAIMGSRPLDLIKFIVGHPDFDFAYLNLEAENNFGKDENNIDVLISYGRVDVIEFLLNDPKTLPKIIFNNQKLTYESARDQLEVVRATFNKEFKKNPHSKPTERAKTKIDKLEKMIPMLAEATIKYAIVKDDPILCIRLEKAGIDLDQPLSEEKKPIQMLTRSNPHLLEWFMGERFAKKAAKRPVLDNNSFFALKQQQAEKDALTLAHTKTQVGVLDKVVAGRLGRLDDVGNITPSGKKTS